MIRSHTRPLSSPYEVRRALKDVLRDASLTAFLSGQHLEQLKSEQERLTDVIKTQNLSPEEVIKMNTDHELLQRTLEDLKQKISESHRTVMTLEVNVANRGAAAEEAVDAYNNLLSTLNLFPPLPEPWQNIDLTLELNTAAATTAELLSGADIRKVVRPTLSSIAESKRAERAEVESEGIRVDDEIDQLNLDCENLEEEIAELEKKLVALNDQADDLRDVSVQNRSFFFFFLFPC
jgi:kinetochore protein NDC80